LLGFTEQLNAGRLRHAHHRLMACLPQWLLPRQGARLARAGLFFDTGTFRSLPRIRAIADSREACRMMALLIETVSWLAALGFIAAIIADTFR
jgi:hypothetical protein